MFFYFLHARVDVITCWNISDVLKNVGTGLLPNFKWDEKWVLTAPKILNLPRIEFKKNKSTNCFDTKNRFYRDQIGHMRTCA